MVWKVEWDGDFVVGGDGARRLTPNFKLREFRFDGVIRVHRELVSSLQLLRNRFARGIGVRGVDAEGLGATIEAADIGDLLAAADALEAHRLFSLAEQAGESRVHVRIDDPANIREVGLEQALESAFEVTSGFETSGDKFQQVTGNFDGAGLSFGPAQVNFGTGTLQPMFEKFAAAERDALAACFTDPDDWEEWQRVMAMPSQGDQVAWANGISTGARLANVMQPWKGYLKAVGRVPKFREIMVETILRDYGRKLLRAAGFLHTLAPDIRLDHLRCFCSLYDLVVQQGGITKKAAKAIRARIEDHPPVDQFDLVRIAVEERGRTAKRRWRADCVSRRLGILDGVPTTVTVSGNTTQRANINFYMLRDVVIRDARQLIGTDVSDQLAAASQALASGSSLLA